MKLLLLNGHGINMHVDGAKLHIKNGRFSVIEEPEEYVFSPKRIDVEHIVIYGQNGNLSIDSIRWLIKHNVQVSILNWNGKLLTTMLPPDSVQVKTKFAQYNAYSDSEIRLRLAKKFISAKFARTKLVLDWLKQRYPTVKNDFTRELVYFRKARTVREIIQVEARIAGFYWQEFRKIVPKKYEFTSRQYQNRPWGAGDMINCMFNYGYSLLEAECLRAINSSGLDPHVGYLHEMNIGKNSLAYDLQEPFRFLIDLAIIDLIESNIMDKKDFIRTENYNLRLRPSGAKKILNSVNNQLNKKLEFQGKQCPWNYILLIQTRQLAHHLIGKKRDIDFLIPNYKLSRQDSDNIRQKILQIGYTDWKKLGFSKGTLNYMKKNAKENKPFTLNKHVRERVENWKKLTVKTQ